MLMVMNVYLKLKQKKFKAGGIPNAKMILLTINFFNL